MEVLVVMLGWRFGDVGWDVKWMDELTCCRIRK